MGAKYNNVYQPTPRHKGREREWRARIRIDGVIYDGYAKTEKEAARNIDLILIRNGKEHFKT